MLVTGGGKQIWWRLADEKPHQEGMCANSRQPRVGCEMGAVGASGVACSGPGTGWLPGKEGWLCLIDSK